jgi:hypothetical protein
VRSKRRTTPISHTGPSDRSPRSQRIPVRRRKSRCSSNPRVNAARRSGFHLEKKAVDSHPKSAEEKQRREVLRHHRKDGSWQGNLKGTGVPSGEIVNHAREQHIEKAAAHLVPPVRSPALRHLLLRNRFAAERTLPQMRRHIFAAKHASLRVPGLISRSAHTGPNSPPT